MQKAETVERLEYRMTKDVLVSVTGSHRVDGEADDISIITAGTCYVKNGKHYIVYEEHIEGISEPIRSTIKVSEDCVEMIKSGEARTHMVFERMKTNVTCYATPYGQMMMGVTTDRLDITESEDVLKIVLDYSLEVNYQTASRCHVEIEVSSKKTARLDLGKLSGDKSLVR